jgi:rubrerythrin
MEQTNFNIDEIFEIAEQIERNGARFYRAAADAVTDPDQVRMLTDLASIEDEHERKFAAMRKELADGMRRESVYEPDDLAAQYLWAWASKAVFDTDTDPFAVLAGGADMEEILKVAIGREKESIVYYEGLKAGVGPDDKTKVDAIIHEEMLHVAILSKALNRLRGVQMG